MVSAIHPTAVRSVVETGTDWWSGRSVRQNAAAGHSLRDSFRLSTAETLADAADAKNQSPSAFDVFFNNFASGARSLALFRVRPVI
jgi:hypothetical protein